MRLHFSCIVNYHLFIDLEFILTRKIHLLGWILSLVLLLGPVRPVVIGVSLPVLLVTPVASGRVLVVALHVLHVHATTLHAAHVHAHAHHVVHVLLGFELRGHAHGFEVRVQPLLHLRVHLRAELLHAHVHLVVLLHRHLLLRGEGGFERRGVVLVEVEVGLRDGLRFEAEVHGILFLQFAVVAHGFGHFLFLGFLHAVNAFGLEVRIESEIRDWLEFFDCIQFLVTTLWVVEFGEG